MDTMIGIRGEAIKHLISQREPMIMVDVFYNATESEADTGFTIENDNLFCNNGLFSESGLIEHIAQSASAFISYKALLDEPGLIEPIASVSILDSNKALLANRHPLLGFLGEVRKCRIHFLPRVGDELHTHIRILSEVLEVSLFAAETKVVGETAVQCQMKIYVKSSTSPSLSNED